MFYGMSLNGGHFHHLGGGHAGAVQHGSQQQQQHQARQLRKLATAAAAATAGAAGVHLYRQGRLPLLVRPEKPGQKQPLVQIPRELAEVICGAFGEIVQVAVLYPLDTIKVRRLVCWACWCGNLFASWGPGVNTRTAQKTLVIA